MNRIDLTNEQFATATLGGLDMPAKANAMPRSVLIHSKCFPAESAIYRAARDELLRAEVDLRRRTRLDWHPKLKYNS